MNEALLYKVFKITVVTKALFACVDLCAAAILTIWGSTPFTAYIVALAQGELLDDPNDFFAPFFLQAAQHFPTSSTWFLILYLVVHSVLNFVFLVGLWRDERWAYPFALSVLSVIILLQLSRLVLVFSPWLSVLVLFDLGMIWLTWHEYQYRANENLLR